MLAAEQKTWLQFDVLAGLTTAAVVIPKAMACATIAGLPLEAGLYVAFLPMLVYALLGTSRPLSVSSTSTIAILVAAELSTSVPNGDRSLLLSAAATLTLLTGGFLLLAMLWLVGLNAAPRESIARSPLGLTLGTDRILPNLPQAIERFQALASATPAKTQVPVVAGGHPSRRDEHD